jgi:hypothetical protein
MSKCNCTLCQLSEVHKAIVKEYPILKDNLSLMFEEVEEIMLDYDWKQYKESQK